MTRPLRERILIALWVLVLLWSLACAAYSLHTMTGSESELAWFGAALIGIAWLPMLLLQYIVVGYANPVHLFNRL